MSCISPIDSSHTSSVTRICLPDSFSAAVLNAFSPPKQSIQSTVDRPVVRPVKAHRRDAGSRGPASRRRPFHKGYVHPEHSSASYCEHMFEALELIDVERFRGCITRSHGAVDDCCVKCT